MQLRCVVSTDLMARGVDLPNVRVVINFDLPQISSQRTSSSEIAWAQLVHRIGRAGRFGSKGLAINLCSEADIDLAKISSFEEANHEQLIDRVKEYLTCGKDTKAEGLGDQKVH